MSYAFLYYVSIQRDASNAWNRSHIHTSSLAAVTATPNVSTQVKQADLILEKNAEQKSPVCAHNEWDPLEVHGST